MIVIRRRVGATRPRTVEASPWERLVMGAGVVGDVGLTSDGAGPVPRNRQDHASVVAVAGRAAGHGPAEVTTRPSDHAA
ncbi:hypothetical protein FRAAL4479 [Frankia alni ACN14a]|uniref:Uncharacterized protein n=1 Tax=Frankia alni (strain DSM 45986 / CECT 9034 / ACN14a) TaxID=326424 RepID=Q0RHB0_FRAAA|nr:hypothetical protein FRAAL4479 [Frankia alni ACN14a]